MQYDAVIIGAGTAGLFTGLKLSAAGKKVLLLEKQPIPGGLATSFTRKGFTFESSVHCVDSLNSDGDMRLFLEESGVAKKNDFIALNDFCRVIYPQHDFVANFELDNYISSLKENFPAEEKNIEKIFRKIKRFQKQFDCFYHAKLPLWLKLVISPFVYPNIIKASCCTVEQYLGNATRNEKLKAIISDIWRFAGLPPSRLSAFYFLVIFQGYYYNPAFYVRGGFSRLFRAMAQKMMENGSELKFNARVRAITTDDGKSVKSVITDKGEEFMAKVVISNANAISTLSELLDYEPVKEVYRKKLGSFEKSISAFQVYLGLKIPAKDLGMNHFMFSINTTYNHDESFNNCLNSDYGRCALSLVDHAQVDPGLVPPGKGSLLIMTLDNYANWKDLSEEQYKERKSTVANQLILRAEKYLPGLSGQIEVMEVGTPMTISRFGTSVEGAIYGLAQNVAQSALNRLPQKTAIKGLILAGAWTFPGGGIHGCFVSAEEAADLALKFLR